MNTVERIKSICKERKIPISRLESELNFGNAYISGLKKGTVPADRLKLIAEYLGLSINYLITGEEQDVRYDSDNAHLVSQIRKDAELTEALKKYFSMSEEQKKHVIATINMTSKE